MAREYLHEICRYTRILTAKYLLMQWLASLFGLVGFITRPRPTFFDGWFIRVTDKLEGCSWAVIVGSVRLAGVGIPFGSCGLPVV